MDELINSNDVANDIVTKTNSALSKLHQTINNLNTVDFDKKTAKEDLLFVSSVIREGLSVLTNKDTFDYQGALKYVNSKLGQGQMEDRVKAWYLCRVARVPCRITSELLSISVGKINYYVSVIDAEIETFKYSSLVSKLIPIEAALFVLERKKEKIRS